MFSVNNSGLNPVFIRNTWKHFSTLNWGLYDEASWHLVKIFLDSELDLTWKFTAKIHDFILWLADIIIIWTDIIAVDQFKLMKASVYWWANVQLYFKLLESYRFYKDTEHIKLESLERNAQDM